MSWAELGACFRFWDESDGHPEELNVMQVMQMMYVMRARMPR